MPSLSDEKIEKLLALLSERRYQTYHPLVMRFLKNIEGYVNPGVFHAETYDLKRADFVAEFLDIEGLNVLDIGSATGYFSIQAASAGAVAVESFESEEDAAAILRITSEMVGLGNVISVQSKGFDFYANGTCVFDISYCLNVLHHVGRYFSHDVEDREAARAEIVRCMSSLAHNTKVCVFQLGFNWKGDESLCLFGRGTKTEMVDFVESEFSGSWSIEHIGILDPTLRRYKLMTPALMEKFSSLGEFGNRPLFILKSTQI